MPPRVWILWGLFLVRGAFYSSLLPLWEGWDEYAHLATIQHWIDRGTFPSATDGISREIDASMRLAPLPPELRWMGPPWLTNEQWWALPEADREKRRTALRAIPPEWAHQPASREFQAYEAQQPPLYYWLLSIPARAAARWPIAQRVQLLRLISIWFASLCLPFTWLMSREVLPERLQLIPVALLAAAPGFAIDVARIANDALLIPAAAAVFWLLARRKPNAVFAGVAVGVALLAKASALALLPALVVIWWRRARRQLLIALILATAIGGWWYARNLWLGQSLTGWLVDDKSSHVFSEIFRINWLAAADVASKSFLWFGGWSFLTLKSWMYRIPEVLGLAAFAGVLIRRPRRVYAPLCCFAFAVAAYAWGILAYSSAQSVPNLPGWYLWPFASVMGVLFTAGLGRASYVLLFTLAFLDIYGGSTVMAPYYAGLEAHNRASLALFPQAIARLALGWPLVFAWLGSTLAIPILTLYSNRRK